MNIASLMALRSSLCTKDIMKLATPVKWHHIPKSNFASVIKFYQVAVCHNELAFSPQFTFI